MMGSVVSDSDRLLTQASALRHAGQPAAAEDLLRQILTSDPAHPYALTLLAELALGRRDTDAAIRHATAVLRQEPRFAPALSHLSQGLWLAGRLAEALEPARQAVAIQPGNPLFRINLGQIHAWQGRAREAEDIVRPVLEQAWHPPMVHARAQGVIADALTAQGAFEAAHQALEQAVALAPAYEPLQMARGMSLLRLGRLEEGWPAYRRRTQPVPADSWKAAPMHGPAWHGQDLTGRTILLRDDQGHGDAIHFFRYIPLLRAAGARRVVLYTFPSLLALFQASTRLAEVVTGASCQSTADFHCLTGDLPAAFGTRLDTIPTGIPYIRPRPGAVKTVPDPPPGAGPSVGLVWSGDPRHLLDHLRSVPAAAFLRIADVPGVRFISLQNVVRPADIPALAARPHVTRLGETLADFNQAAALVSKLDLVITVDTAVAHLAGAMGKPVWVLVPRAPDWRWLIDRPDSPWYPTMRLFRAGAGGWAPVIRQVIRGLGKRMA